MSKCRDCQRSEIRNFQRNSNHADRTALYCKKAGQRINGRAQGMTCHSKNEPSCQRDYFNTSDVFID